jgi:hypothetical protein
LGEVCAGKHSSSTIPNYYFLDGSESTCPVAEEFIAEKQVAVACPAVAFPKLLWTAH